MSDDGSCGGDGGGWSGGWGGFSLGFSFFSSGDGRSNSGRCSPVVHSDNTQGNNVFVFDSDSGGSSDEKNSGGKRRKKKSKNRNRNQGILEVQNISLGEFSSSQWLILFIVFICEVLTCATTLTFGVSLPPLWANSDENKFSIVAIGSLMLIVICAGEKFNRRLLSSIGYRPLVFFGGIIFFVGTYFSIVALKLLYFTVFAGFGLSMIRTFRKDILNDYFGLCRDETSTPHIILTLGSYVGALLCPVHVYLQNNLGWNATHRIFGGFGLACTFFSLFACQPKLKPDLFSRILCCSKERENSNKEKCDLTKYPYYKEPTAINKRIMAVHISSASYYLAYGVCLFFITEFNHKFEPEIMKSALVLVAMMATELFTRGIGSCKCNFGIIALFAWNSVHLLTGAIAIFTLTLRHEYEVFVVCAALIGFSHGCLLIVRRRTLNILSSNYEEYIKAFNRTNVLTPIFIAFGSLIGGALYSQYDIITTFYFCAACKLFALFLSLVLFLRSIFC